MCFNTSIFDEQTNRYMTSRRSIAKAYLMSWFWIDMLAIIPRFSYLLEEEETENGQSDDFSQWPLILKLTKITRVGRLIKLLRLLKLAKAIKMKDKLQKHM